jgi:AcrR family transcriptional regulator
MARTLNPVAHAVRRDAFIEVAQRLIQSKGYEQLSIQDVLDELGASKGAFYHYFDSKQALLAAVVERMADAASAALMTVVDDPDLTAVAKLEGLFSHLGAWKSRRKELVLELIRVWFSDENAIVREQLRQSTMTSMTALLATIVRQGQAEGAFTIGSPAHTAEVLVALIAGLNDAATRLFVARQADAVSFDEVELALAAYLDAFERILGLPAGSFRPMDDSTMHFWFG